jgi:hypothetical protein
MSIDKLKTKFFTGAWLTDVKHYFTKINEIIDYLNGIGKSGDGSYKVYTAILNQGSTDAPTAIVLNNTLGEVTYTYEDVGTYLINSNGLFIFNKTWIYLKDNDGNQQGVFVMVGQNDENSINIFSFSDYMVSASNSILNNMSLEIRVYN